MLRTLGYALIGTASLTGFSAFAESPNNSGSRAACRSAENKCEFKCAVNSGTSRELEHCESVCLTAYDTCLSFADVLEPPARNPGGGKPTTSTKGDAATGGAVMSPKVP